MKSAHERRQEVAAVGTLADVARLRWRCRRGMRELDVLLLRYLDRAWDSASRCERDAFARLVDLPDPELLGYLVRRAEPAEDTLRAVVEAIRQLAPRGATGDGR
jgi:antitoxin CptB